MHPFRETGPALQCRIVGVQELATGMREHHKLGLQRPEWQDG